MDEAIKEKGKVVNNAKRNTRRNAAVADTPALRAYHPFTAFLLLGGAVAFSMLSLHPVYVALSIVAALLSALLYRGISAVLHSLPRYGVLLCAVALFNTVMNQNGITPLFYIRDYPILREGMFYGLCSAGALLAVLLWFQCINTVLDGDRIQYLFASVLPTLALLLSMTLRRMAGVHADVRRLNEAQSSLTAQREGKKLEKLYHGGVRLSALIGSTLENAVTTAESMRARGYGSGRRTRLDRRRLRGRDAAALLPFCLLTTLCVVWQVGGAAGFQFYPVTQAIDLSTHALCGFILYAALLLLPFILEAGGKLRWILRQSGI